MNVTTTSPQKSISPRRRQRQCTIISSLKKNIEYYHIIGLFAILGILLFHSYFRNTLTNYNDYDDEDGYNNYNNNNNMMMMNEGDDDDNNNSNNNSKKTKVQVQKQLEQRLHKQYHSLVCTVDNNDFMKYNQRYFTTIKDPNNNNQKYIATTKTNPSFYVSLNNQKYDKVRWDIMTYKQYYEHTLSNNFIEIIRQEQQQKQQQQQQLEHNDNNDDDDNNNEPIIVMDVGSNVGWFSLLSASMGSNVHVYTFEATPIHLLRLCESLALNNWTTAASTSTSSSSSSSSSSSPVVNLYNYAVGSNPNGQIQFLVPDIGNPGKGSVATPRQAKLRKNKKFLHTVNMLSLDAFAVDQGWLPREPILLSFSRNNKTPKTTTTTTITRKRISILKIDVEKYELEVMKGSKRLLQSGIVDNIFMELSLVTSNKINLQLLKILIEESNYYLYKWGNFRGPNILYYDGNGGGDNNNNHVQSIMKSFITNSTFLSSQNGANSINTWWKLKK